MERVEGACLLQEEQRKTVWFIFDLQENQTKKELEKHQAREKNVKRERRKNEVKWPNAVSLAIFFVG